MKQLFTLIVFTLAMNVAIGQTIAPVHALKSAPEYSHKHAMDASRADSYEVYIDYDNLERAYYTADFYKSFYWTMNSRYVEADDTNTFLIQRFVVAYDTLFDPINNVVFYPQAMASINIDTVAVVLGWENNSGTPDTIIMDIIKLSATGNPINAASGVLWSDTTITTSGATPENSFDSLTTQIWTPNLNTTEKRFGIRMRYYGSKMDTFAFVAGYGDRGACNTQTSTAYNSIYRRNSFTEIAGFNGWIAGNDLYYDCNGDQTFTEADDAAWFIQNIWSGVVLTIDYNTAIDELASGITAISAYPNPAAELLNVAYRLENASNVAVSITDVTGRVITNVDLGHKSASNHTVGLNTSNLAAGVYVYSVTTDRGTVYRKFQKQ